MDLAMGLRERMLQAYNWNDSKLGRRLAYSMPGRADAR